MKVSSDMAESCPEELIFSGGNFATLSFLGSVQSLVDKGELKIEKVRKYIGTSGGAIMSFLLAIGYSPVRIFDIIKKLPIGEISKLSSDKYLKFFDRYGLHDTVAFRKILCVCLEHLGWSANLTFEELYDETNIELCFTSYCLNTATLTLLDHKNTPELKILDGVCMSIAVPFLFYPVSYQNRLYVDAFLMCNHPVELSEYDKSLSFCLKRNKTYVEDVSLLRYLRIVMNSPVEKIEKLQLESYKGKTITVSCDYDFDASFDITEKILIQFYNCGYRSTENIKINDRDCSADEVTEIENGNDVNEEDDDEDEDE